MPSKNFFFVSRTLFSCHKIDIYAQSSTFLLPLCFNNFLFKFPQIHSFFERLNYLCLFPFIAFSFKEFSGLFNKTGLSLSNLNLTILTNLFWIHSKFWRKNWFFCDCIRLMNMDEESFGMECMVLQLLKKLICCIEPELEIIWRNRSNYQNEKEGKT